MSKIDDLAALVDDVPDFPEDGILFRDISPLLLQKWPDTVAAMRDLLSDAELENIDAFVGLEARGFKFAGALAAITGKGMVMARKAGKLPEPLCAQDYALEYGTATIEMKPGNGERVFIVDDVLATGGTLAAAADLAEKSGYEVAGFATLIDLSHLNDFAWNGMTNRALLTYDADGYVPAATAAQTASRAPSNTMKP